MRTRILLGAGLDIAQLRVVIARGEFPDESVQVGCKFLVWLNFRRFLLLLKHLNLIASRGHA